MTTKTKAMIESTRKTSFDFALLISKLSKNWSYKSKQKNVQKYLIVSFIFNVSRDHK